MLKPMGKVRGVKPFGQKLSSWLCCGHFLWRSKMKRFRVLREERSRSEKKLYSEILGKLFDAQEDGETVIIKYKDQMIKGVISIVQVRNDTFEIETLWLQKIWK